MKTNEKLMFTLILWLISHIALAEQSQSNYISSTQPMVLQSTGAMMESSMMATSVSASSGSTAILSELQVKEEIAQLKDKNSNVRNNAVLLIKYST